MRDFLAGVLFLVLFVVGFTFVVGVILFVATRWPSWLTPSDRFWDWLLNERER